MAIQSIKVEEKLTEFISLTLIYKILKHDNGSYLIMCSIITLGEEKLSWLCALSSEKQEGPWQVCLSSTSAVWFCTLSCSLCRFSPCSFNMMDLFGKSFRWWEDRKKRKLTLSRQIKRYWPLAHTPALPFPHPPQSSWLYAVNSINGWCWNHACLLITCSEHRGQRILPKLSSFTWILD